MSRFRRKQGTREPKPVIHIYTEGEKTEPNYFKAIKNELRVSEIDIKVIGLGDHTDSLVKRVIEIKNGISKTDEESEWWVVFDKDDHDDFNQAIDRAGSKGINVAYSNECFELWFVLHFEYLQSAITREDYNRKLTELLGQKYDKTNSDIYHLIKDKENTATENAKKLDKMHDQEGNSILEKRNPSTTVYKLVTKLRSIKTK